jgi:molecular chaperone GrpE
LLHRRRGILTKKQREEKEVAEEKTLDAEVVEEELTEATAEEGEEEPVDEVAALRQELEEAKAKEAEYLDGWQRARAELANARKRFQREREQAYANSKADLLIRLLPVVDDFDRAFESLPDNPSTASWIEGVKLVQRKFLVFLEQERVEAIEAAGQEFDPLLHQAVTHEPSTEVPEGLIIAEIQRGYRVSDRVLRPGVVRVSAGPPPEPEPDTEAKEQEAEADIEKPQHDTK